MYDQRILEQIREKIENAARVAIFSHIRPDGDTLGSLFGLGARALKRRKIGSVDLQRSAPEGGLVDEFGLRSAGACPERARRGV